jgi:parallel beta-helix repeat protein
MLYSINPFHINLKGILLLKPRRKLLILFVVLALLLWSVVPVFAGTITVDTAVFPGVADGDCSLDDAIAAANTDTPTAECPIGGVLGDDIIQFDPAITIIDIDTAVVLDGADPDDNDIIDGGGVVRFTVTAANVTISDLVLQNFAGPAIQVNAVTNITLDNNVIYDVAGAGIQVLAGASNVTVTDSVIGYSSVIVPITAACSDSPTGTTAVGGAGILVGDADGTIISGNTIACSSSGLLVTNGDGIIITNNNIGTDPAGLTPAIGGIGNSGDGIVATNVTNIDITDNFLRNNENGINLTGVTCPVSCQVSDNIIGSLIGSSGNRANGIVITGSDGIVLGNNTIRDNGDGFVLPAGENGVLISGSTGITFQGGIITGNNQDGIAITGASTMIFIDSATDPVLIFDNGGLGIDLDNNGVSDTPATNGGQSFPTMTSPAYTDGATLGGLTTYDEAGTAHFYSSSACDPSGFGEGETYLDTVGIGAAGATFYSISPSAPAGSFITVITVDAAGNTSEFSQCALVVGLVANFTPIPATQAVGSSVFFDNLSTTGAGISYTWDFGDGSPISNVFEPSHIYSAAAVYTVELCVAAPGGLEVCTTQNVTIIAVPTPTPTSLAPTGAPPVNIIGITPSVTPTTTVIPLSSATPTLEPIDTLTPVLSQTVRPTSSATPVIAVPTMTQTQRVAIAISSTPDSTATFIAIETLAATETAAVIATFMPTLPPEIIIPTLIEISRELDPETPLTLDPDTPFPQNRTSNWQSTFSNLTGEPLRNVTVTWTFSPGLELCAAESNGGTVEYEQKACPQRTPRPPVIVDRSRTGGGYLVATEYGVAVLNIAELQPGATIETFFNLQLNIEVNLPFVLYGTVCVQYENSDAVYCTDAAIYSVSELPNTGESREIMSRILILMVGAILTLLVFIRWKLRHRVT